MKRVRRLSDAQHEAAHIVVGVALGMRFYSARLIGAAEAECVWYPKPWPHEADLIMTAAGVAWEREGGDLRFAAYDLDDLRAAGVRGNARVRALERAAWAVLMSRPGVHARVARALLDHDLTEREVRRMGRGW